LTSKKLVTDLVDAISHIECALRYIESEDDSGPQSNVLAHAVRMLWQLHDLLDEQQS
jgi:hypothetical protein